MVRNQLTGQQVTCGLRENREVNAARTLRNRAGAGIQGRRNARCAGASGCGVQSGLDSLVAGRSEPRPPWVCSARSSRFRPLPTRSSRCASLTERRSRPSSSDSPPARSSSTATCSRCRTSPAIADDILKVIEWLEREFDERGFTTERLATPGSDLLLATRASPGAKRTVLIYLQADGQPVDPSRWFQDSPWTPTLKERRAGAVQRRWQPAGLAGPAVGEAEHRAV